MTDDGATSVATGKLAELVAEINALVIDSYGLSKRDGELLQRYLLGMTEPWVEGSGTRICRSRMSSTGGSPAKSSRSTLRRRK